MMAWLLAAGLAMSPGAEIATPQEPVRLVTSGQLLALPPTLRAELQSQVIDTTPPGPRRLDRLAQFLFSPEGARMTYRHDANHSVEEAWRTREANCLSFTLMAIALAREAGFKAYGQEYDRTLSWSSDQNTIYLSTHVNAGIEVRHRKFSADVAGDSVLLDGSPKPISDEKLLSIYYNNLSATALQESRLDRATRYAEAALRADDRNAMAWNTMGVIHLRQGQVPQAEDRFLRSLQIDPLSDGALLNLALLYADKGDQQRANQYRRQIERARQRNPFHHFMLAIEAEKRSDHAAAAAHYRDAIARHDHEHRFHFGLARAYLHLGQSRRAGQALRRAQQLSEGKTQMQYQAKLDRLQGRHP